MESRYTIEQTVESSEAIVSKGTRRLGTAIYVKEDACVYICAGNLGSHIHDAVRWKHSNVWIPDHVIDYLADKRKGLFESIHEVSAAVLARPLSVHADRFDEDALYIFAAADELRRSDLLHSQTSPFIDAVIELRRSKGIEFPRLFHLSPRSRNLRGIQLWP